MHNNEQLMQSPREVGSEIHSEVHSEIGDHHLEQVGHTGIRNFENSGLVTNEQVATYLRETLPPTHLEQCSGVMYVDERNPLYPNAVGLFNPATHQISIHGPSERFVAQEGGVYGVITHEVGHNVHENLSAQRPDLALAWAQLHEQSRAQYNQTGLGFVSSYAHTNLHEDFAESYAMYVRDPAALQFYSPEKYEFMRQAIFAGRTYPQVHAYWDYDSAGNKIEVTSSGVYDLNGNRIAWSL